MRIRTIFECSARSLYAVLFENSDGVQDPQFYSNIEHDQASLRKNEFDKALDRWQNAEYLRMFFNKYRNDLTSFDSTLSVNNAVKQTIEDADDLVSKLADIETNADRDEFERLFRPLSDGTENDPPDRLQKLKGRGLRHRSWLRLYALRYGDSFVVTGGAIKLTQTMNSRQHLKSELYKLELVRKFLKNIGREGLAGYIDIV